MIRAYHDKKQELDEKFEREKPEITEDGKEVFKLDYWVPGYKNPAYKDEGILVEVTTVNKLEIEFFEEYEKVMEKDKSMGKDFNKLAYEEAKKAKYFFEYMKTQE